MMKLIADLVVLPCITNQRLLAIYPCRHVPYRLDRSYKPKCESMKVEYANKDVH